MSTNHMVNHRLEFVARQNPMQISENPSRLPLKNGKFVCTIAHVCSWHARKKKDVCDHFRIHTAQLSLVDHW